MHPGKSDQSQNCEPKSSSSGSGVKMKIIFPKSAIPKNIPLA
jgi:hypothetical protein